MNQHPKFPVFQAGMPSEARKQQQSALHNKPSLRAKHAKLVFLKALFLAATRLKMNQLLPILLF